MRDTDDRPGFEREVDHLARRSYSAMVARLVRALGARHLELAEDVVQEAFVRALRTWHPEGLPREPERWLQRVAKNLAIDTLRRRSLGEVVASELGDWVLDDAHAPHSRSSDADGTDDEVAADDTLRMMFLCAHPSLPPEARSALVLKSVCGLGNAAIAAALLAKDATVAQRLTRAKAKLTAEGARFEMPSLEELPARLEAVLDVLYLLFNEGYRAHGGAHLVRVDLVHEAVRLAQLLVRHPRTASAEAHALLALMLLQGARLPARSDSTGRLLTLAEQDRRVWDQRWIGAGMLHFERSLGGPRMSAYHVEAAIASLHTCAATYADTDWTRILAEYDRLSALRGDEVVRLNRAVALAKVHGPRAALAELDVLEADGLLGAYGLRLATRAQLMWQLGDHDSAARALQDALQLPCTEPERRLLEARLDACRRGDLAPVW